MDYQSELSIDLQDLESHSPLANLPNSNLPPTEKLHQVEDEVNNGKRFIVSHKLPVFCSDLENFFHLRRYHF